MNEILEKFIDEQTPEQIQAAFAKIRDERGHCPNDISVEEALGISTEFEMDFKYPEISPGSTKSVHINSIPCNNKSDVIFEGNVANETPYSLAA